jgi:hypothetical protein
MRLEVLSLIKTGKTLLAVLKASSKGSKIKENGSLSAEKPVARRRCPEKLCLSLKSNLI